MIDSQKFDVHMEQKEQGPASTKKEKRQRKRDKKHMERKLEARRKNVRKLIEVGVGIAVVGGIALFLTRLGAGAPKLPPTTELGHSEASPPEHIVTEQIPDSIQRHMLEHSDGSGPPGVIIQYNCDDYDCGTDLIANLTDLVGKYPANVYLAPSSYDGKIILTRAGDSLILDTFEEESIRDFIEN